MGGRRAGRLLAELEARHDALFLGIGLGQSPDLRIEGENLSGVVDALDFIEKVTRRTWKNVDVGRRVAVVGAGNTAIDAVTEARRLGAEQVMIVYRRSAEEMSAYDFEYELAKSDTVQFHFLTAPVRVVGNTHVEGLECVRMRLGAPDVSGRRTPEPIPGSEFILPDTHIAGGILPCVKIGHVCEAAGLPCIMHCGHDLGPKTAAMLHVAASQPAYSLANDSTYYGLVEDILIEPFQIERGTIAVPTKPGLGYEVDLDAIDNLTVSAL